MSRICLETLEDTILSLGRDNSWPRAIWFVDRATEYWDMLKAFPINPERPTTAIAHLQGSVTIRFCGVPLFTFDPLGATEAELACRPKFCSTPGVWLEMSDGQHVQVDVPKEE